MRLGAQIGATFTARDFDASGCLRFYLCIIVIMPIELERLKATPQTKEKLKALAVGPIR
jgi:hypothetical protein